MMIILHDVAAGSVTRTLIKDLELNTMYFFKLRASTSVGIGKASVVLTVQTKGLRPDPQEGRFDSTWTASWHPIRDDSLTLGQLWLKGGCKNMLTAGLWIVFPVPIESCWHLAFAAMNVKNEKEMGIIVGTCIGGSCIIICAIIILLRSKSVPPGIRVIHSTWNELR